MYLVLPTLIGEFRAGVTQISLSVCDSGVPADPSSHWILICFAPACQRIRGARYHLFGSVPILVLAAIFLDSDGRW